MPELPEVETIRRGLEPLILWRSIKQIIVDQTTPKSFRGDANSLENAEVTKIWRRGKALLMDLSNGKTLMIHLRMTGQLIWRDALFQHPVLSDFVEASVTGVMQKSYDQVMSHQFAAGHPSKNFIDTLPNSQTRVIFVFNEGKLFFNDQRKFGFVKVLLTTEVEREKFIAELGKEPWEMEPEELFQKCQRHARAPIKAVLLDQKVIAGIGNIYADESLFYAQVHPAQMAGTLSKKQVAKILEGVCQVMNASIDSGGSTMATYIRPDGSTGDYLEMFAQVFRRNGEPCVRCGGIIQKTKVAGRGTHFCEHCQQVGIEVEYDD